MAKASAEKGEAALPYDIILQLRVLFFSNALFVFPVGHQTKLFFQE